jgi:hypothetical protein
MMRGQVVPEEARAWTAGLLLATDYFANARRDAVARGDSERAVPLDKIQAVLDRVTAGTSPATNSWIV